MAKIAINIVLLTDKNTSDKITYCNSQLQTSKESFTLGPKQCIPHASLAMGSIEEKDLSELRGILTRISITNSPLKLQALKLVQDDFLGNDKWMAVNVEKSIQAQQLHQEVIDYCSPYLSNVFSKEMFYSPKNINDTTIKWASNQLQNADSKANLHISVGVGNLIEKEINEEHIFDSIAICLLGKYCTCREEIFKIKLKKRV
jgi:hypothetical protein